MAFTKTAGVEYGTPAVVLSTTAAAGSNQTAIRTDGQLIVFGTDVPESIAYGQSAATGSDALASRLDHDHGMAAATVVASQEIQFSRTIASGSGDQAITGAGFEPTAVIFFGMVNDTAFASWGWGDDSLGESCMYSKGSTPVFTYSDVLCMKMEGAGDDMAAVLKSLDSDGCTITWTKSGSGQDTYNYCLFLR